MIFNKKGITLIALVITIIVVLILTTLIINILTGENGILEKAKLAKEKSAQANNIELSRLDEYNSYIENYTTRSGETSELEARIAQLEQFSYTEVEANGWQAKKYNNGDLVVYKQLPIDAPTAAWGSIYTANISVPGDYPVIFTNISDISTSFISNSSGASSAFSFVQGYNSTTANNESEFLYKFPNNLILGRATNATFKGIAYIKVEGKWK